MPSRKIPSVDKYVLRHLDFDEIVGPVSAQRQIELLVQIRENPNTLKAEKAKQEIVQRNLRLVANVAFRYISKLGNGRDICDLMQAGTMGLVHAINKFDTRKGAKFSTYATWWIRDYIQVELGVRKKRNVAVDKTYATLRTKEQRDITVEDMVKATGLSRDILIRYRLYRLRPLSLDGAYHEEDKRLSETITYDGPSFETEFDNIFEWEQVREIVHQLPPKDAEFVKRRFGIGNIAARTRPQLAEFYNISESQACDWERKVLKKLRGMLVDAGIFGKRPK